MAKTKLQNKLQKHGNGTTHNQTGVLFGTLDFVLHRPLEHPCAPSLTGVGSVRDRVVLIRLRPLLAIPLFLICNLCFLSRGTAVSEPGCVFLCHVGTVGSAHLVWVSKLSSEHHYCGRAVIRGTSSVHTHHEGKS